MGSALAQNEGHELTNEEIGNLPGLNVTAGITYRFAGTFENQIRSEKRLQLVLPLALFIRFLTFQTDGPTSTSLSRSMSVADNLKIE